MKKFGVCIGLALMFGLFSLAGCDFTVGQDETAKTPSATLPSVSEELPSEGGSEEEAPREEEGGQEENGGQGESGREEPQKPAVSPLALLDAVDVSAAFGDREAEGWSFGLKAEGGLNASYGFDLTSQISGREKLNTECGIEVGIEDLFGLRSNENNAFGFNLFGGGKASLALHYRGPDRDSDPLLKNFEAGFRHDGDLIWYAGEGENESKISLTELKEKLGAAAMTETFGRMGDAFAVIPEELSKGVSLRLAVEKLIALGFTAEIDDSDGVAVSLKANAGFYTDLLNDMLEELLPSDWLTYLPRADFGYERTVFNIRLAFGKDGLFQEYSMSSDVALTASLEVRNLFVSHSVLKSGGDLSFTAYSGEIGAAEE